MSSDRKILISAMKNEAPFVLEWVAYHRVIGFNRIVVYSNASDDGTNELLDALQDAGVLTHVQHQVPEGVSPQMNVVRLINEGGVLQPGDWALWLDADEFLNVHVGDKTVDALIEKVAPHRGMLMCWRIFGDSGNKLFPGRYVSKHFDRASRLGFRSNREVKTIYQVSADVTGPSVELHRPQIRPGSGIAPADFLNGAGREIDAGNEGHLRWLQGTDFTFSSRVGLPDLSWDLAQINHYCVRTPEFFALKRLRGRGWAADQAGKTNLRHTPAFYEKMNCNDTVDASIIRHEAAVDAEIARILSLPGVGAADADAKARVQGLLGKLSAVRPVVARRAARKKVAAVPQPTDFKVTFPAKVRAFVESEYRLARTILEYGSGGSTFLAANGGAERVVSVESDKTWAARITAALASQPAKATVTVHHADIGPTIEWGFPAAEDGWRKFHTYPLGVWQRAGLGDPDVALIDGRFRLACFGACMMMTRKDLVVLFDDYTVRKDYHVVEKYFKPVAKVGRMAKFEVTPGRADRDALPEIFRWFTDVR